MRQKRVTNLNPLILLLLFSLIKRSSSNPNEVPSPIITSPKASATDHGNPVANINQIASNQVSLKPLTNKDLETESSLTILLHDRDNQTLFAHNSTKLNPSKALVDQIKNFKQNQSDTSLDQVIKLLKSIENEDSSKNYTNFLLREWSFDSSGNTRNDDLLSISAASNSVSKDSAEGPLEPQLDSWLYEGASITTKGETYDRSIANRSDRLIEIDSIVKDNHLDKLKQQPARSKILQPSGSKNTVALSFVAPPSFWSVFDVAAENYTTKKIVDEINVFSIRLLNQENIEKLGGHNIAQIPFAIYKGLSLLSSGAHGETAKEFDRVLLGSQTHFDLNKQAHDLDRRRLSFSFADSLIQLQSSAINHRITRGQEKRERKQTDDIYNNNNNNNSNSDNQNNSNESHERENEQHLIMANNLLFSPRAFEISPEFKHYLTTFHNDTITTKVEAGSKESVHVINSWVRDVTQGIVPTILNRKETFDEFNVMALLCTAWLKQSWQDSFYRISSNLRTGIRLKGHGRQERSRLSSAPFLSVIKPSSLLEFVDDKRDSHFVEYIVSRPSPNIQHFRTPIEGFPSDIVVVPFLNSNHRWIAVTPLAEPPLNYSLVSSQLTDSGQPMSAQNDDIPTNESNKASLNGYSNETDSSLLSKFLTTIAENPSRSLKSMWSLIAPDIITRQIIKNIQLARQMDIGNQEPGDKLSELSFPFVQLSIPVFKTNSDSSMVAALNHIGLVNSFESSQADFIGINGHPFNYNQLHLSDVIMKTTFNLDEEGVNYDRLLRSLETSKNQSVRRVYSSDKRNKILTQTKIIESTRRIDEIKLNRPFVYFVADIKTKLILFSGVIRNPKE